MTDPPTINSSIGNDTIVGAASEASPAASVDGDANSPAPQSAASGAVPAEPTTPTSLTLTGTEASDYINIISNLVGQNPNNLGAQTSISSSAAGEPVIQINHTHDIDGDSEKFKYNITLANQDHIEAPTKISTTEENNIRLPIQWVNDPGQIKNIENNFRALTISDPKLNSRFNSQEIKLADFQKEAVKKGLEAIDKKKSALIVMPTATGKTVVAWDLMDKYLEKAQAQGKKVLFIVNNKLILNGAYNKLLAQHCPPGSPKPLKPEDCKYSCSKVYDYEYDTSGDVILATPGSLLSEVEPGKAKLDEIFEKNDVAMVIYDEVHHLPAKTNKLTLDNMRKMSPDLVHVGFTATPDRIDEGDVFELFGNQADYELGIFDALKMGYLTPWEIIPCDQSINPENKSPIEPGTELAEKYKSERYDFKRFPEILETYNKLTADIKRPKTLILAADNHKATKLAEYLDSQGVPTVALTSDQQKPPYDTEYFDDNYHAWSEGQWPEGSQYEADGKPVPKVAVAVEMFREGVDVPDINLLMLWRHTDSLPLLTQMIGRGLRPAPGKTHLKVADLVGQMRNLKIVELIVDVIDRIRSGRREEGATEDRRVTVEEILSRAQELGITVNDNIANSFRNFFNDVPRQIARRYRTYSRIHDPAMLQDLDLYLTNTLALGSPTNLHSRLRDIVGEYNRGELRATAAKAHHDFFKKAFFPYGSPEAEITDNDIPVTRASQIVFYRLYDIIHNYLGEDDIEGNTTEEILTTIFTEFDKDRFSRIKRRARNLALIRSEVFQHALRTDMMRTLISDLLDKDLLGDLPEFRNILEEAKTEVDNPEYVECPELRLAEAYEGDIENIYRMQERFIEGYLQHPRLSEKLTYNDFQESTEDFLKKLASEGLSTKETIVKETRKSLFALIREWTSKISDIEARTANIDQMLEAIDIFGMHSNPVEFKKTDIKKILEFQTAIKARDDRTEQEDQVIDALDKFLRSALVFYDKPIRSMDDMRLGVFLSPGAANKNAFGVNIYPADKDFTDLYRENAIKNMLLCTKDSLDNYYVAVDSNHNIYDAYNTAPPRAQNQIVTAVARAVLKIPEITGQKTYIVVKDAEQETDFYEKLFERLQELDRGNNDVIGFHTWPDIVNKKGRASAFEIAAIDPRSTTSATDADIRRLARHDKEHQQGAAALHLAVKSFIPLMSEVESLISNFGSVSPQSSEICNQLKSRFNLAVLTQGVPVTRYSGLYLKLSRIRELIGVEQPSDEHLRLLALYLVLNSPHYESKLPSKPGKIKNINREYIQLLELVHRGAIENIDPELFADFWDLMDNLLQAALINGVRLNPTAFDIDGLEARMKTAVTTAKAAAATTETEEDTKSEGSDEVKGPPFFTPEGKLALWASSKPGAQPSAMRANFTIHWDKACDTLSNDRQRVVNTDIDRVDEFGKLKFCKKCSAGQSKRNLETVKLAKFGKEHKLAEHELGYA